MAAAGSALQRFSEALRLLYEAADKPVLSTLQQLDGKTISDSTLSTWLNGGVPGTESTEYFRALIRHLNAKASTKCTGYVPVPEGQWMTLLKEARHEKDQKRGGRPSTRRPPQRTPRRQRGETARQRRDHVFTSHEAWIEQLVRPATLLDREDELQELETFCTAPDVDGGPAYAWWQAEPWAGKSALMAEFVIRRRSADVEVVSYFIGDRFGNNDRDSFLHEVNQQLAVVAERDPSPSGVRPKEFLEMCRAAAEACRRRGRRLVLLVDGLDEDRGAGPGGLSIASLLPKSPPAGMRVVVTGRPNPPVPDGVPHDHPLRDLQIVRPLDPSPHARLISDMAGRELQQLLNDVPIGNDLLGLLTVARGALTGRDVAELIDVRPHDISSRLRGITGRSFLTTEAAGHFSATGAEADRGYVLGHQELRQKAMAELGDTALAEYEARLHAWADEYQASGWPPDTPPYLLYDYPRVLRGASGTERLVSLVLDPHRQLALLARSSVDTALSEVELTHQMVERETPGDLGILAALAASRDMLYEDARALPPSISVAFARLGHPQRAMGLARTAPYPEDKAIRLAKVACVLASTDHEQAIEAAQEAARWAERARRESAPTSGDEYDTEVAAGEVAVALISVGQDREGRELLDSLRSPAMSGDEMLKCRKTAEASLAARPRSPELAEELLNQAERYAGELSPGSHSDPAAPVTAWTAIARAAAPSRAARLHGRISEYAHTFSACLKSCTVHATAASALVAGRPDEAAALAQQAAAQLRAALRAPESLSRDDAAHLQVFFELMLTSVAQALVDTGSVDDARELVTCVPGTMRTGWLGRDEVAGARAVTGDAPSRAEATPAEALAQQACELAEQGNPEEAKVRLQEALAAFASSSDGGRSRDAWLITLCGALAISGFHAEGERLARSLRDPVEQVQGLAAVATSTAAAGYLTEARRLAHEAADRARTLEGADDSSLLSGAYATAARRAAAHALAHARERERALSLADEEGRAEGGRSRRTLVAVAAGLSSHDPAAAAELIDQEREKLLAADAGQRERIVRLAELIAAIGDAHPACKDQLDQTIARVWSEERASGKRPEVEDILVAVVLAPPEQREEAHRALEALTKNTRSAPPWEMPTGGLAVAHAAFGNYDAARLAADRHNVPADRAEALAAVAAYLARTPAGIQLTSDSSTAFTQTLRSLVLLEMPPTTAETSNPARRFVADALVSDGWHHALPVLAVIAPNAVRRVWDIVFTHRREEISGVDRPPDLASKG
ncbi:hypothetical protein HHX38_00800 [Streptomyces sp. PKU-MA01144]|uniref:hypothetical protein n=1 Tax=Streptomyces sp. PKU-MA01144 TaxID=2729138 RepID=UPI001481939A|nr:hypothetical protein [Streptomyces sp. PKU-MA01144]NNJ02690.1 hypothetical protein [Streptomyces sp. PKU-MA01144]